MSQLFVIQHLPFGGRVLGGFEGCAVGVVDVVVVSFLIVGSRDIAEAVAIKIL